MSNRTPGSSRSSPTAGASSSTEAPQPSSSGFCRRRRGARDDLWGSWALYRAPEAVLDVHRSYVAAGCDVVSTNTWSVLAETQGGGPGDAGLLHWMDIARNGIRLARTAASEVARPRAVAFSLSEDAESLSRSGTTNLLAKIFDDEQPDLILLETLSLIREPETFTLVEELLELGLPVWVSFRRCRHGVCGVYGQHWGPPEGDLFGRAARRFEEMGVGALLINCLPVDHVPGMVSWLRDFTELPLGVYPNLGHLTRDLWRFDERIDPEAYAALALEWREEGAQIIGGCCGVSPEHIAAAAARPSREQSPGASASRRIPRRPIGHAPPVVESWRDERGRTLYPLPFPDLAVEPGRLRTHARQLSALEAPPANGRRRGWPLPRRRLRLRDPRRPARAQRGGRRARDRHRPWLGREHAGERVPERRLRPRHRRHRRPLPVGAGRAVRPDRREPLPDARRPLRGAERPPPTGLLGAEPLRPLPRPAPRAPHRPDVRSCSSSPSWAR